MRNGSAIETAWEETPDWSNLSVIHRNTLPPRSYFFAYPSASATLSRDLTKADVVSLSGTWKLHVAESPLDAPVGFSDLSFDHTEWKDVTVPGMWQLQGFGRPQYLNVNYPFPVHPPQVPLERNQCGSYLRYFSVPEHFLDHQIRLRFEGVDSAFHLYLNGEELGYSQGSRNPSEFDITDHVRRDSTNILGVRVYQYCDGSYLEDQDQWRLSGIFRDVLILAFPPDHIEDFHIKTILDADYKDAVLEVGLKVTGAGNLVVRLMDDSQRLTHEQCVYVESECNVRIRVDDPRKWTAEDPYLYHLALRYGGKVIAQRIGFRSVQIQNGTLLVNGRPIVIRGVNRHEHHPLHGRSVPLDFLRKDLITMKRHNINAIRTSHQPNDPRLYDLTDELGFWIMDEADLECHGFASVAEASLTAEQQKLSYQDRKTLTYTEASKWTSDNAEWKEAYVDRARQLVMRDKNHPSVIMWSLGNEAFYGRNFQAMYDCIREVDDTRPIHYEGDLEAQTVDLYSRMYPTVDEIVEFASDRHLTKPLVLCEFSHAMGNGPGNLKEYVDAFYKHQRLVGGFVWEWANHGLLASNEEGKAYYAYGGDFGEEVHDYNFVMDGLCLSDHSAGPGLVEYAKVIEPVQLVDGSTPDEVAIINRYDFLSLDHLRCECSYVSFHPSRTYHTVEIPRDIPPGDRAVLSLPEAPFPHIHGCFAINLDFYLKGRCAWASSGHKVASLQLPLNRVSAMPPEVLELSPPVALGKELEVLRTQTKLIIDHRCSDTRLEFSLSSGLLTGFEKGSCRLLRSPPTFSCCRPLTDNDRPQDGQDWLAKRLHQAKAFVQSMTWTAEEDHVKVVVKSRFAPPVLAWSIDLVTTYRVSRPSRKASAFSATAGSHTALFINIHVKGTPKGNTPPTLARLGLDFTLPPEFSTVTWLGRGPGQSYVDSKLSQQLGIWTRNVNDLWIPYEFPQENGNRTDVQFVDFLSSSASLRASFPTCEMGGNFTASHYAAKDIDECTHPWQLDQRKKDETFVRLDWAHHGLGSGSCGPKTLDKYALKCAPFEYEVTLE